MKPENILIAAIVVTAVLAAVRWSAWLGRWLVVEMEVVPVATAAQRKR